MSGTIDVKAVSTKPLDPRRLLSRVSGLKAFVDARRARENAAIDRELGINTGREHVGTITRDAEFPDSVHYEAVDYPLLRLYLGRLVMKADDVAFDIGCGAGRMLCELARRPIAKAIGIEISPELAQVARQNAQSLKGRQAEIEVIQGDATKADYAEGTIYTMFNPFGADTMQVVLDRIGESLKARPREIKLAYINPVCDALFMATPWLQLADRDRVPWRRTEVAYYVSRA